MTHERGCRGRAGRRASACVLRFFGFGRAGSLISAPHVYDDDANDEQHNHDDCRQQRPHEDHVRGRRWRQILLSHARAVAAARRASFRHVTVGRCHRARLGPFEPEFRRRRTGRRFFVVIGGDGTEWPKEREIDEDVDLALAFATAGQRNSPHCRTLWDLT